MKFPVFSLLAGNLASETSSLLTAPSSGESGANLIFGGECHRWLWRLTPLRKKSVVRLVVAASYLAVVVRCAIDRATDRFVEETRMGNAP